jgi:hypothetical protein
MKFSELSIGDRFRFFRRGTLLTKTGATSYASDQMRGLKVELGAIVLPEISAPAAASAPADPYGASNLVEFQKGWVRLDGVFTAEQLGAVLANMQRP